MSILESAKQPDKLSPAVKLADGGEVWKQSWFLLMLLEGLGREGLDAGAVAWLKTLAQQSQQADLAALRATVSQQASGPERERVAAALDRLSEVAAFNARCYRRLRQEDERVTAWPNNPRTKIADPDFYFDIYEDLPYRKTHRFIEKSTPIGSAGSCFALRIAHQLQTWDYNYVIEEDDYPSNLPLDQLSKTNFRMAPARCGTLFNTPSMRQMVERAFGLWEPDKILVKDGDRLIDPFRSIRPNYADESGYLSDFDRHTEAIRRALMKCDVFILTLGLTEAWKFAHSGDYTSVAPYRIDPTLIRPHELTVAENLEELERLFSVYRKHNPKIKLIISVSPVPLAKTFSTRNHVVAANSLSKATLRVAAEEFCRNHPGAVFYLPSYEVVTYGTREPWEKDMRHVSAAAVARVMNLFRTMFLTDQTTPLPLLMHEESIGGPNLKLRAKGWAKAGLRAAGLYRRS